MILWLFQIIWLSDQGVDACNATSVGVVFASRGFGSGPKAASHFSPHAVGIDELFHPQKNQSLDLW